MKPSSTLFILPFISACSFFQDNRPKTIELPNIVVFFVDDLGYYNVGFRNNNYFTPNIDKLAKEGVVFENAYVPAPTCSPSRIGLLTGQHSARLRFFRHIPDNLQDDAEYNLWNNDTSLLFSRNWLPSETVTYAKVLKKHGYNTFFAGKWHIGDVNHGPEMHSFDVAITKENAGNPKNYYPPYFEGEGWWNDVPLTRDLYFPIYHLEVLKLQLYMKEGRKFRSLFGGLSW